MSHSAAQRDGRQPGQFHLDQGDQMPYRWPRGFSRGPRFAEVLVAGTSILMILAFFAFVAYMVHWQWG
jgi:hypothetical protein